MVSQTEMKNKVFEAQMEKCAVRKRFLPKGILEVPFRLHSVRIVRNHILLLVPSI